MWTFTSDVNWYDQVKETTIKHKKASALIYKPKNNEVEGEIFICYMRGLLDYGYYTKSILK